ncbi:MAG TPA: hypothetical protein VMU85_06915 [Stellaceae bacterium]|nr:hypothetical protein [Stellaceae bacterium]
MQQGPEGLRAIAASCLQFAEDAEDEAERALLVSYAAVYHDLAVQLESLASTARDSEEL